MGERHNKKLRLFEIGDGKVCKRVKRRESKVNDWVRRTTEK